MAQRLQVRGGTQAQNEAFVGANREITVDTTNWAIRIHDGTTPGGHVVSPGPAGAGVPDGGLAGQVDAIKLAIAKALTVEHADLRSTLKKAEFLKRDPREKERKKYGLRSARKREQYSKR